MDGILKAMTSVKEELANELAKLTETNKALAQEKAKLANTEDYDTRKQIQSRIPWYYKFSRWSNFRVFCDFRNARI